ncbi:hypothetical protein ACI3L8_22200 [Vibrio campbellii]|uniref:hypothetical protein n=1 Tax=Vibrio campbellii TaxID=680 RepID=UPI003857AC39
MILKLLCLLLFISLVATVYASPTNQSDQRDELDDPTALSSFIGFRSGTNGYGAIGQLSFNRPDSHFGHNSFLQFKDDFETIHLRHFSIYKSSGTGVFVDAQRNNAGLLPINRASIGAIQIIPISETIRINPAVLYGSTWTDDKQVRDTLFPTTPIVTLYSFVRWQMSDDWFVNLVPQYTYSLSGKKIRLFELVTQVGHNITKEATVSLNADEDDNFWLTLKHAL